MKNLCSGSQCGGFQFLLILDLWGISFHAVVVFPLGKNLLFIFVLGHCGNLRLSTEMMELTTSPTVNAVCFLSLVSFFLMRYQSNTKTIQDKIFIPQQTPTYLKIGNYHLFTYVHFSLTQHLHIRNKNGSKFRFWII